MASIVERRGRFCVVYSYKDKNGKRRQKSLFTLMCMSPEVIPSSCPVTL